MDKKKVINATGWDCPLPLLALKKELASMDKGETIDLTFTCPEAVVDIPAFCEKAQHDVLSYEKLGTSGWRIVVKK